MKIILSSLGLFTLLYFIIIAILFFLGYLFPYQPSFLHSKILIPVTIVYIACFFFIQYLKNKKRKS
jgi:hypothetical protein